MRLFALVVLCVISLSAEAQRARPSAAGQRPAEFLRRSIAAQSVVRFAGVRVVQLVVNGERRALTEIIERDGFRSRTTYPEDSPRKGFVIVENGMQRWEYDPQRNEIMQSRARRDEAILLLERIMRAAKEGQIRLQLFDGGKVAEQPAAGLALGDGNGNIGRRFWIDRATGVLLKAEYYGRVGEPQGGFEFTRITYGKEFPASTFAPLTRRGARVVGEGTGSGVSWKVVAPTWLPDGFRETGRGVRNQGKQAVLLIHFSDGAKNFTLFQSQGRMPKPGVKRGFSLRTVVVNGISVGVMGDLAPETLERIAQSLR